ncbi:MAG: outer membrane protein assembly factor BamD [Pseudomonadota bacterium]|nr:outer membrane protein assembly factor BamD [Pseudomonadota bacterium]
MSKNASIRRLVLVAVVLILTVGAGGCAWWKDLWSRKQMAKGTPEALYSAGVTAYKDGRYKRAVEHFTRLKEENPLHPLALQAEIGIGDAHFSDGEYAEAELAYTDFVNLHPTNENNPYVIYQLGMCHYKQMSTIDRDQSETAKAVREFERVIARHPDSKFAFLAEQKLRECRQQLAEREFYIGEFYFKRGKYEAALKRFQTTAETYSHLGLDYKVKAYIAETRRRLLKAEEKKRQEEKKAAAKGVSSGAGPVSGADMSPGAGRNQQ